eukprot:TRINITY_DN47361_c0_g1_i1.p1 TRINITY_DN47361_c0_g1~~TRINITY_DN47361_c0_g1_i1.p1  ORF type:complete len:468 (+),score=136.66 TRINITY_DN47361_c0_g1_i1:95-1405(+)
MGEAAEQVGRLVRYAVALFLLLLGSGLIIQWIEDGPFRERQHHIALQVNSSCERANLTADQRRVLQTDGILIRPQPSPWTLWGSCFFCLTAVTTIGYGGYVPVTDTGRLFTVAFTLGGMVLVGYTFAAFAEVLVRTFLTAAVNVARGWKGARVDAEGRLTNLGLARLKEDFENFDKSQSQALTEAELAQFLSFHNDGKDVTPTDVKLILHRADKNRTGGVEYDELTAAIEAWYELHPVQPRHVTQSHIFIALGLCCLSTACATIAYHWAESWTPGEAAWFAFCSMTTVGFGDVMPQTPAGQALVYVFIVWDLGMLAYLISAVAEYLFEVRDHGPLESQAAPALPVDISGDGVVDHVFIDTTGDGKHDQVVSVSAPPEGPHSPKWSPATPSGTDPAGARGASEFPPKHGAPGRGEPVNPGRSLSDLGPGYGALGESR